MYLKALQAAVFLTVFSSWSHASAHDDIFLAEALAPRELSARDQYGTPSVASEARRLESKPFDLMTGVQKRDALSHILWISRHSFYTFQIAAQEALLAREIERFLSHPSVDRLHRELLPTFDAALFGPDENRAEAARRVLPRLIAAYKAADPTGRLLADEGVPYFQRIPTLLTEKKEGDKTPIVPQFIDALPRVPPASLVDLLIPFYEYRFNRGLYYDRAKIFSAELEALARYAIRSDPSEKLFEERVYPLYERALTEWPICIPVLEGLGRVAFDTRDPGGFITMYWGPLFHLALRDVSRGGQPDATGQAIPNTLMAWSVLALRQSPNNEFFNTFWMPFYRQALETLGRYEGWMLRYRLELLCVYGAARIYQDRNADYVLGELSETIKREFPQFLSQSLHSALRNLEHSAEAIAVALVRVDPSLALLHDAWPLFCDTWDRMLPYSTPFERNSQSLMDAIIDENPSYAWHVEWPRLREASRQDLYDFALLARIPTLAETYDGTLAWLEEFKWLINIMNQDRSAVIAFALRSQFPSILLSRDPSGMILRHYYWPFLQLEIDTLEDASTVGIGAETLVELAAFIADAPSVETLEHALTQRQASLAPEENDLLVAQLLQSQLLDMSFGVKDDLSMLQRALRLLNGAQHSATIPADVLHVIGVRMVDLLGEKATWPSSGAMETLVRIYWPEWRARHKQKAKDQMAYQFLDFLARANGLPPAFAQRIRLRGISYAALLPLFSRLGDRDALFVAAIQGYEDRAADIPASDKNIYWGTVETIVLTAALNWDAYERLGMADVAKRILASYAPSTDDHAPSAPWTPFLQKQAQRLERGLLAEAVGRLFHFEISPSNLTRFTDWETRAILYVARHADRVKEEDDLNQTLGAYFKARLAGDADPIAAFEAALKTLESRATQAHVAAPPPLTRMIHAGSLTLEEKQLHEEWFDVVANARLLAHALRKETAGKALSRWVAGLPADRFPDDDQRKSQLRALEQWFQMALGTVPADQGALANTLRMHATNVRRLSASSSAPKASPTPLPTRATISIERDPIKKLHLGWPNLGNSCLDCVIGPMQEHAAEFALDPALLVIFIHDARGGEKPLARVAAYLDAEHKRLVLLSPIKQSNTLEFEPLVGEYLAQWADAQGLTIVIASSLKYGAGLGPRFQPGTRTVTISPSGRAFYSDLGTFSEKTSLKIEGWVLEPLQAPKSPRTSRTAA